MPFGEYLDISLQRIVQFALSKLQSVRYPVFTLTAASFSWSIFSNNFLALFFLNVSKLQQVTALSVL